MRRDVARSNWADARSILSQGDGEKLEPVGPQMVYVLEWKPDESVNDPAKGVTPRCIANAVVPAGLEADRIS